MSLLKKVWAYPIWLHPVALNRLITEPDSLKANPEYMAWHTTCRRATMTIYIYMAAFFYIPLFIWAIWF